MRNIILLICLTIDFISTKCRMKQDCDVRQPGCSPSPANYTEPEILLGMNVICPEYYNKTACCNDGQNILMKNNFDSLDAIFGSKYGGCDVCAINLKRFWCHFTCSPDQDKFMNVTGYQDFIIENINYTLLMIDMNLNSKMNCELFNSCKKTKYASQVVAMGNAIGFTTFQGTEAYRKSPVFINMNYVKEGGLIYPVDNCDTQPEDGMIRGFPVEETCKCNSCGRSCHYTNDTTLPILEGFSLLTVGLFYLIVVIFTIIISVFKYYYSKNHPHDHSRSSSIDSNKLQNGDSYSSGNFNNISNNTNNNINTNINKLFRE